MKKIIIILLLSTGLAIAPTQQSHAIIWKVITEAIKKVVRAMDLQVQRIQNATIDLQNVQKELENALSKLKLKEISEWTDKQKQIYKDYFDELWKIKAILSYYSQVKAITDKQKQLFKEYQRAYTLVSGDKNFSPKEIDYMLHIYTGILDKSIASIDDILQLLKSFTFQMSDASRLEIISKTSKDLDGQLTTLRKFKQKNMLLSVQRAKSLSEIETIKKLYGSE